MRVIDCTISAFGTLKDRHIDFSEGITCIFEENGFGKTTLAAFIKAMFYGLPTARKNQSAEGSERAKFYPWGGGNFGGRLTFEVNSKKYRIIRSFDRYSITADTFELIDAKTGLPSGDFDENIGAQLFGVDESGFVRSTFSNGTVSLAGIPASIRNKISSVTENADDMDEFEKANQKLAAAIKAIGGKNGALELSQRSVQSARNEIERCKREIEEYDRISAEIIRLKAERNELEEQKTELSHKLKLAQGAEAAELKLQNYNRLLEKCEQLKKSAISIMQKYEGICPDKEKISELETAVSEHSRHCLLLSAEKTKQNSQEFRELCSIFEQGLPTDDEMGSISSQIRAIDLCNNNIKQVTGQKEQLENQLSALGILNAENIPDETELNEIRSLSFNSPNKNSGKPKASSALFIVLSAVLMVLGAGACFVHLIAGIALSAVGAVALIASLLLASVRKMVGAGNGAAPEDIRKTEEFLLKFGFSKNADISAAVDRLKTALRLKEQIEDCEQRLQGFKEELADTLALCWKFMDEYGALREEEPHKAFEALSRRRDRYLNE
ncbi:MAG: AAA family ATPase, partial [Oscillospiraceae bacterium]|nr:AAA family ATPase [Oscillospiraceae bacterium]